MTRKGRTMARILVQTNDCRTVLDERDVQATDIDDGRSAGTLLDRLGRAVRDAELDTPTRTPIKRLAAILPASDYRAVGA
jgi:hypothetical protein